MLQQIERLAKAGFALHWLHPKSKRPIGDDWSTKPVASWEKLQRTYDEDYNVGVRLGKWSLVGGDYFLHAIDLDIRDPDLADEARAALRKLFPLKFGTVPTVMSGSGGESRHYYILTERPFPSKKLGHSERKMPGTGSWGWEIELFGTGKQVALPPSIHPDTGRPYRWLRPFDFDDLALGIGPIVDSSIVAALVEGEREERADDDERSQPLGLSAKEIERTLRDLPLATYCDDREGWLSVGMALHHETGGSDEGFDAWCRFAAQSDKFDKKDQRRVWKSFGKNRGSAALRMATLVSAARDARLEREFENLDAEDAEELDDDQPAKGRKKRTDIDDLLGDEDEVPKRVQKLRKEDVEVALGRDVPPRVARLNKKHAVARVSGKTVILDFKNDGSVSYGSANELHTYYENDRVATEKATEPVTKAWMRHKQRRDYPNGIVFSPKGTPEGTFNHWQGFAVDPNPKASCKRFLNHVRIICDGDEAAHRYLLGWLAHMIQHPEDKPGVATVLRGKKGVGKDTIGDYVGLLFPQHHVKVANRDQLLGKFNAHQERCLLLHVEEGYWAGDRGQEGPLKFLITSPRVPIEPKGMNVFYVDSVLRVFMSSNEEWVVPATGDERRYFVVNVGEKKRGDRDYFNALREEMEGDGPAALLHYLQNYDLTDFDVRDVPDTAGLAEQKVAGLKNIERWWHGILMDGELPNIFVVEGRNSVWTDGPVRVESSDFRDTYDQWMRGRRFDGSPIEKALFGRRMRNMVPPIEDIRLTSKGGDRPRGYVIPPLDVCRELFETFIGSKIDWPDIQP